MEGPDFAVYEIGPVQFAYPLGWQAEATPCEEGASVFLQSSGATFAIVGAYSGQQEPLDLVQQSLESLREEHPGLEAEEMLGQEEFFPDSSGVEALFFSLDVLSYCWIRSWRIGRTSVVVLLQSTEPESHGRRLLFDAICRSVQPVGG